MRVTRLGLTPLKSTRHQAVTTVDLDADGPVGDRTFCLVDPVRSRVLRTIENPSLVAVSSCWEAQRLRCDFPDGTVVEAEVCPGTDHRADYWGRSAPLQSVTGPWADAFSAYLGRPVELARIRRRGAVVYGHSVTLVHAATLSALAEKLDQPTTDLDGFAARFRSTVVLSGGRPEGGGPAVEAGWVGHRLRLGTAEVEVLGPVPRCAVIDLDPVTGVRNLAVLRAAGVRPGYEPAVGVDAVVVRPGRVVADETATLLAADLG